MFLHKHPFEPYIFAGAVKLIVGTLPPPRFSLGELKPGDVNFCYGSKDGQLWPILDAIYRLDLVYETTDKAIQQRKEFLLREKIGICDIVASAERARIDASDLGMDAIILRDLIGFLRQLPLVDTLLFTGGTSKNGPEYLFRKLLKEQDIALMPLDRDIPRVHCFKLDDRVIKTVSLTAPSGAANRAVGSMAEYQRLKDADPNFNTFLFRVMQYRRVFCGP